MLPTTIGIRTVYGSRFSIFDLPLQLAWTSFSPETSCVLGLTMAEQLQGPLQTVFAISAVPLAVVVLTEALTPAPTISPKSTPPPTVTVVSTW